MRAELMSYVIIALLAAVPLTSAMGGPGKAQRYHHGSQQIHQAPNEPGGQSGERHRNRLHATNEQREQLRSCLRIADQMCSQVREFERLFGNPKLETREARHRRDRLFNQIQNIQIGHETFVSSLTGEQREELRDHIRSITRCRIRFDFASQELDQAIRQNTPDRTQATSCAREMEQALQEWLEQYRQMGVDLDVDFNQKEDGDETDQS